MGAAFVLAGLLFLQASSPVPASPRREAVVLVAVENMYAGPDENLEVVSQATLGQVVELLETSGPFARVRTPDHCEGWLTRSTISEYADDGGRRYARAGRVVEVTSLMANLYRDPDVTTARPRALAPLSTLLEVAADGPSGRWLVVRLPSGEAAYVQGGDVRSFDPAAPRPRGSPGDLVATARRFLGTPYLWGGMTARGIDCSGLASRVYHANGVELPRDADQQFDDPASAAVDAPDLRPGDLLFFGSGPRSISHVGIYEGDGRFINATTHETPVVREDRLDDPHWSAIFQGARRPR
jgi:gamma-D-glutamyl-L-lysine dipeptidyl-peptidase